MERRPDHAWRPLLGVALATTAVLAPEGAAQGTSVRPAEGPFTPGVQWSWEAGDPSTQGAWIPGDVAFAADGETVWASRGFTNKGATLLGAQEETLDGPLLAEDSSWTAALAGPQVEASGSSLFAAGQFLENDARRTRVSRSAASFGVPTRVWSVDLPWTVDGDVELRAADDDLLCVERLLEAGQVRVSWLDVGDGRVLRTLDLPGGTLRAVDLSHDGERALVLAGERLYLVDRDAPTPPLGLQLTPAPNSAALAPAGDRFAVGRQGRVELYGFGPLGLEGPQSLAGSQADVAVALDLAPTHLAVGWWESLVGRRLSLDVWELTGDGSAALAVRHVVPPVSGGLLNYVADVQLQGRRAAFGLWGDSGPEPELVLLDAETPSPLLEVDLEGSVFAVDLDPGSQRVAVARKRGHATFFETRGAVELIDTGERDLALDTTPRAGRPLRIDVRRPTSVPSASPVFALFGRPAEPLELPGLVGELAIDPSGPLLVLPALGLGQSAAVTLALPATASGLQFAVQAVVIDVQGTPLASATASHLTVY